MTGVLQKRVEAEVQSLRWIEARWKPRLFLALFLSSFYCFKEGRWAVGSSRELPVRSNQLVIRSDLPSVALSVLVPYSLDHDIDLAKHFRVCRESWELIA